MANFYEILGNKQILEQRTVYYILKVMRNTVGRKCRYNAIAELRVKRIRPTSTAVLEQRSIPTLLTRTHLPLAGNDTVPISMWRHGVCAPPSVLSTS